MEQILPDHINANHVLVSISKEAQRLRRERIGEVYFNPHQVFLKQNMQHGRVLMIGDNMKTLFDSFDFIGHDLLFHHFVEGSMQGNRKDTRALNERYLLYGDNEFNYYIIPKDMIYGVAVKEEEYTVPTLYPASDFLFAKPVEIQKVNTDDLVAGVSFRKDRNLIEQKLQRLQKEVQEKSNLVARDPQIMRELQGKEEEMHLITRALNGKKVVPFRLVNHIAWYVMVGEAPTSIEYKEEEYYILRRKHVLFIQSIN